MTSWHLEISMIPDQHASLTWESSLGYRLKTSAWRPLQRVIPLGASATSQKSWVPLLTSLESQETTHIPWNLGWQPTFLGISSDDPHSLGSQETTHVPKTLGDDPHSLVSRETTHVPRTSSTNSTSISINAYQHLFSEGMGDKALV